MCTGVGRNAPCAPHDEPTTGRPSVALPATVNLVGFLVALNVLRMCLLVVLCSLNQRAVEHEKRISMSACYLGATDNV